MTTDICREDNDTFFGVCYEDLDNLYLNVRS